MLLRLYAFGGQEIGFTEDLHILCRSLTEYLQIN